MTPEALLGSYYIAFGILTIIGGIIGYAKARSVISLVSGLILGGLLISASFMFAVGFNVPLFLGLLASLAIAGKFIPDFIHRKAFFPAGIMSLFSIVSVALTIFIWYVR